MQTGNVLIPIVSLGITNAILRFGLEKGSDEKGIFTTGLAVICAGEVLLALFYPLLRDVGLMGYYAALLMLYVFAANLHSLFGTMAQALGRVRIYAVSGIVCTVLLVAFNVLLLSVFHMGITGYILSNVIADALAAVFLFAVLRLWRCFRMASLNRGLIRNMFRYCLPLIPATVCSWIINISDRYFISYMLGADVSGLYAVANKISTIMLIISNIFTSAWQLSAMEGRPRAEKERFFSNVYSVYEAGALTGAAVLMAASRLIMRFLAAPDYFSAWHYAPVLTLGNALLIPVWGAMGAAASTLASYAVILAARALHSRRLLKVRISLPRFLAAMAILALECFLVERMHTAGSILCCAAVALLYAGPLLKAMRSGVRELFPHSP